MTYKAIGFDWGGVINGKPGKFFGESMARLLGITHDQFREAYFHHNGDFNRGNITTEELWRRVLEELGKLEMLNDTLNLVDELRKEEINNDVFNLVNSLRNNGYKVGLLSNNTNEKAEEMRAAGYDKHFDVFHISAETGLVKPEAEAYRHFSEELGVNPEALIFIDDTPTSLSSASEVGYEPVLFESYKQLIDELKKRKITV